jgi:Ser/Thr protein kinase RdoA (MazF antagonist)
MAYRLTYTYSQLSASSAGELVAAYYDIAGPLHGKFYLLGLHDNYLIEGAGRRYILRIYRNDWRSPEDVYFELELLAYLRERNVPVAWPMCTIGGELGFRIESPEGERMAALFHYAEGRAPADGISTEHCVVLGRAVSNVHHRADTFKTDHTRPDLDLHYLVDESIEAIRPFLDSHAQSYIDGLHKRLRLNWPDIPREAGMFGVCIGDVNATNFHITGDGKITLFDFDQCGFGFRAFEIAKFASSLHSHAMKRTLVGAFLDGYQEGRPLSRVEYEAIPYFELVANIWVLAIHAKNANRIGYKRLEKPFWDRNLAILKELEAQQGAPADVGANAPRGFSRRKGRCAKDVSS